MMLSSSFSTWINHFLACMGSCLGCSSKPEPITNVDEPSKNLRIQGQSVTKSNLSDGFWSTSTYDLDNYTLQSQKSLSSISTSNLSLGQFSATGSSSTHSEFVNHGALLWNQTRLQWIGCKKSENRKFQEAALCWSASSESLLGTNKNFPQPIPLTDMVDFLVDIWEQEGLYD